MHIIITGGIQSGKSTLTAALISFLKEEKISLAGILAPGLWRDNQRQGFDLIDLRSCKKYPLARRRPELNEIDLTPFEFFQEGLNAGSRALALENCRKASVIIIDEVGKLELNNSGWANSLQPLLTLNTALHIWVVREKLVDAVRKKWQLDQVEIVDIKNEDSWARLKNLCLKFTNLN